MAYSPEQNGPIVSRGSILSTPCETFLSQTEVLRYSQDGEGQASN